MSTLPAVRNAPSPATQPSPTPTSTQQRQQYERQSRGYAMSPVVKRVYADAIEQKSKSLNELIKKYYSEAERVVIHEDALRKSIERQVVHEVTTRRERLEKARAERDKAALPPMKTLSSDELAATVKRVYEDCIKRKADFVAKKDAEVAARVTEACPRKKLSPDEQTDVGNRLCKPKKRVLTVEEINRIMLS